MKVHCRASKLAFSRMTQDDAQEASAAQLKKKAVKVPESISKRELKQRLVALVRTPTESCRRELTKAAQQQWDAFGTGIMMKRRRNRWLKSSAFTCVVSQKIRSPKKLPKRRRIPKQISWIDRRRRFHLSTDVVATDPQLQLQTASTLGPGDSVHFDGRWASVGMALRHPTHSFCVTTAGHLFRNPSVIGGQAQIVTARTTIPMRIEQCVIGSATDYALLSPLDPNAGCDNLYDDMLRLGPVYEPTRWDLGAAVFVLDGFGNSIPTVCRGVNMEFRLPSGHYTDVIVTDACTVEGQSGSCLVDGSRRIWGFVLGVMGMFTLYFPAHRLLIAEGAQLAQG